VGRYREHGVSHRRRFLKRLAALAGAATVVGCYPIFVERYRLHVNRYRVTVPRLPAAFDGYTIAFLSDLHLGLLNRESFINRAIAAANQSGADLIACGGDYVHEWPPAREIDNAWRMLRQLQAPDGVIAVLGNHDHWADTARSLLCLSESGFDLRHRTRSIERDGQRLWFAGAGDLWEDHLPLDDMLGEVPTDECRVVLAHNPDTADSSFGQRVDFMLCGHTHGGQVRIPGLGAPVLPVANRRYSSGVLSANRGFPMLISRGIGWAVYPVRFNCPPEVAVVSLHRAPETSWQPAGRA
jgi:uncharacterized protein